MNACIRVPYSSGSETCVRHFQSEASFFSKAKNMLLSSRVRRTVRRTDGRTNGPGPGEREWMDMEGGGSRGGEAFAFVVVRSLPRWVERASAEKPPLFTPIIEFKTGPKPKNRPPNPPARRTESTATCARSKAASFLPAAKPSRSRRGESPPPPPPNKKSRKTQDRAKLIQCKVVMYEKL